MLAETSLFHKYGEKELSSTPKNKFPSKTQYVFVVGASFFFPSKLGFIYFFLDILISSINSLINLTVEELFHVSLKEHVSFQNGYFRPHFP